MNAQILSSLLIIGLVTAAVGGATFAYFSDTETSEDNIFTAGELNLQIDSDCHFNGMNCTQGTWDSTNIYCDCKWGKKDLTTDDNFFDFTALKPGDSGEVTISMHVSGDNYYVRSMVNNTENFENDCKEQETEVGDDTCGTEDNQGELGANMDFAFWADMGSVWGYNCPEGSPGCTNDPQEGDNILNSELENATYSITSGDGTTGDWAYIIDPSTMTDWVFIDGSTYYLGVAWCVGDLAISETADTDGVYAITCDGSSASSIIQSDSYSSDMTFEVQQATHNSNPWQ